MTTFVKIGVREEEWGTEQVYLIPPDHPYVTHFLRPAVHRLSWNARWRVKWRDFQSIMQDAEFDTEAEARHYARAIMLGPHTTHNADCEIERHDQYWRDLAHNLAREGKLPHIPS